MAVANESRYGGLNGSARYAIFIGARRANSVKNVTHPMDNASGVQVLYAAKHLVQEV